MNLSNVTDQQSEALMQIWQDEEERLALCAEPTYFVDQPTDTYLDENENIFS